MSIETLIDDIYRVLDTDDYTLQGSSVRKPREGGGTLRMSNIGRPCLRQTWYSIHEAEGGEDVLPHTKLKFAYGDILEDVILDLAEMAGHQVTHRQEEVSLFGVTGHTDAVISGMVVDVKTASKYSFQKFEEGLKRENDSFGYLDQLGSYHTALRDTPEVTEKERAAFLVINKETGRLCLDVHTFDDEYRDYLSKRYEKTLSGISSPKEPPRFFAPEADGKSGNYKLNVECSYCPFRFRCYPETRTFLYANGPRYLTKVVSTPKVPEVDKDGNVISQGYTF